MTMHLRRRDQHEYLGQNEAQDLPATNAIRLTAKWNVSFVLAKILKSDETSWEGSLA